MINEQDWKGQTEMVRTQRKMETDRMSKREFESIARRKVGRPRNRWREQTRSGVQKIDEVHGKKCMESDKQWEYGKEEKEPFDKHIVEPIAFFLYMPIFIYYHK